MIRTDATYQALKAMQTVKQVGGDFRDVVMEIHGMWDKNAGSLERLGGKLTTSIGTARVWSINQLRFRDSNAIVNRCGSTFLGHYDAPRYPAPAKFELPPWNTPPVPDPDDPLPPDQNDPPILPVNPQPDNTKQEDLPADQKVEKEPAKQGPSQPASEWGTTLYDIVISPNALTFEYNEQTGWVSASNQGFEVSIVNIDTGDPAFNLPILNPSFSNGVNGLFLAAAGASSIGSVKGPSTWFGMSTNKIAYAFLSLSDPPTFAQGTVVTKLRISLIDIYTGKPINNVSGVPLSTGMTVTTIRTGVPAGSVIVTASSWPGITVGTIFKKSVNTNGAYPVDCWYPGGGTINVNAVSPVIFGIEPFLVRDWASGVGDYGYRIPQNFTKPPVGTFNGLLSSAPSLNATFAAYP